MPDNKSKIGKSDGDRINVKEDFELAGWAKRLGVTPAKLKQLVKKVGPMLDDVKAEIGREAAA
ncbi:MAG: DUF3606 domain-containing protein [Alphaproteobacteria bacterium]|nr:DUF3606 domain-containing protein [Alphaproteobacteria bacterium]